MFNRKEESWHDINFVDEINKKRFKDEYSAKYLNKVYHPEYRIRMVERVKPNVCTSTGGIGGRKRNFKTKEEIL